MTETEGEIVTGINRLIAYVNEQGVQELVYSSAFPVTVVVLLFYFFLCRKKYDITAKQAMGITCVVIPSTAMLSVALAWVAYGFQFVGGSNVLRVYVVIPFVCMAAAKLVKLPTGKVLDFVAPAMLIWNVIGQTTCPFVGCCAGYPCTWGIWNPILRTTVFPLQWLISLMGLGVLVLLLQYEKKTNYSGSGKTFALFLTVWGSIRFFLEYFKNDDKIILGLSRLALISLLMLFVGAIWLFTMNEIEADRTRKEEMSTTR